MRPLHDIADPEGEIVLIDRLGLEVGQMRAARQCAVHLRNTTSQPPHPLKINASHGDGLVAILRTFRYGFEVDAKAISRPELTLKDLRHIAAIAWVRAGVHIRHVQRYLGHTSLSQTMKYCDYEPDTETESAAAERAAATLNRTADVRPIRRNAGDSLANSYAPSTRGEALDAALA